MKGADEGGRGAEEQGPEADLVLGVLVQVLDVHRSMLAIDLLTVLDDVATAGLVAHLEAFDEFFKLWQDFPVQAEGILRGGGDLEFTEVMTTDGGRRLRRR